MLGHFPIGYLKKLLDIPNVVLAPPEMGSRELVINANMITTISGSIGLEGLIMKVPVIVLGGSPFNFLPKTMLRHVSNPESLGFEILNLIENYYFDEDVIRAYLGAVMKDSVPVDFYSKLLKRKEAFNPDLECDKEVWETEKMEQFVLLADYVKRRYKRLYSNSESID